MRVVIRTDASIQIGTGHVMRCLTLADALRACGAQVTFVCREHPGHLSTLIESDSYRVVRLSAPRDTSPSAPLGLLPDFSGLGVSREEDARETFVIMEKEGGCDWLIVDHYALDATWETAMRPFAKRIMVIDDLADRLHDCDILLDQNYYKDAEHRYTDLTPRTCNRLLGPRYAILRHEFIDARKRLPKRGNEVRRIFVFFGGADANNATGKALEAICRLGRNSIVIDVVVGSSNPHIAVIRSLIDKIPTARLHVQVTIMAELMASADLAIGACGSAVWERCYLGLPTIVLVLAHNQRQVAQDLADAGIIVNLGDAEHVTADKLSDKITQLISDAPACREMSRRSLEIMSVAGNGISEFLMR